MAFRISFLCEDKNLAKVLTLLSGLVHDMQPPQPVIPRPANGASGDRACDIFLTSLKTKQFTLTQLREFLPTIGHSAKSCGTQLAKLLKEKRIKRARGQKAGTYEVVV